LFQGKERGFGRGARCGWERMNDAGFVAICANRDGIDVLLESNGIINNYVIDSLDNYNNA
jgi:hypothetical protein